MTNMHPAMHRSSRTWLSSGVGTTHCKEPRRSVAGYKSVGCDTQVLHHLLLSLTDHQLFQTRRKSPSRRIARRQEVSNLNSEYVSIPNDAWMRWHELASSLSDEFFPVALELRDARRRPSREMLRRVAQRVQWVAGDAPGTIQRNAARQLLTELNAAAGS